MSALDILTIAIGLAGCVAWIAGARRVLLSLIGPLAILMILQRALEGIAWQFVPLYLLLLILIVVSFLRRPRPGVWMCGLIVVLMLALVGPWFIAPVVPTLPAPSGPYAVGSQTFRWVDPARLETATTEPQDHRNVIAQAWYPTSATTGRQSPYLDGVEALPPMMSVVPGFIMRGYGRVQTHAVQDAPISGARRWPLVVFSPGYGATRSAYTSLVADLASRGYVVLALDHPYEAALVRLADGRLVSPADAKAPVMDTEGRQDSYMSVEQDVRAADLRFALDRFLASPLGQGIDPGRIAAIGHSFGGATAIAAAERDPRLRAAANLDGTLYGDIADRSLGKPFLLIRSDYAETGHGERFVDGARRLFANLAAPGWYFEIKRANHYSFTDAPLYLAPPARFAASRVIGGGRGPKETQRTTNAILDAFLKQSFGGADDPAAAAKRFKDITPVQGAGG